ncbi:MAG: ABC transporter permease, partial [Rhodobacter sp.]|nr:ABC transporter permease [Rhodobacter sp.]
MFDFIRHRLLQALISILGVLTIIFFALQLSGDPVVLMVPVGASQQDIAEVRRSLGLDRPLLIQYANYILDLVRLNLGNSLVQNVPVTTVIADRMGYTIALAATALAFALICGVTAGIIIAVRRDSWIGHGLSGVVLAAQSLPTFWSGILLIFVFAVWLGWLPPSGAQTASSIILPALALGFFSMATFARITRMSVLEELSKEYVRTARSKGIGMGRLVVRHVLRNASIPIIAIAALETASLLTGAIIVETMFAWPGLGQVTIQALSARDFPVVQGIVLVGAVTAIGLNLMADLLYAAVDPRVRYGYR